MLFLQYKIMGFNDFGFSISDLMRKRISEPIRKTHAIASYQIRQDFELE